MALGESEISIHNSDSVTVFKGTGQDYLDQLECVTRKPGTPCFRSLRAAHS